MKKLLILTLALLFFLPLYAENEEKYSITTQLFLSQQSGKLNPKPRKLRRSSNVPQSVAEPALTSLQRLIVSPEEIDGVMCISSFIRLTDNSDVSELESLGVIVRAKFANGLITAFIPVDKIEEVAAIGKVTKINVASLMRSYTDKGREYTNTDDVLEYTASAVSAGLPNAYDGSGVLLGITDSGIDFQHVAFKDADGGYRAVGAYQVKATQDSYGEYSYTRNEYNQSTMANATTDDESDHGTHTSSTAGGSSVVVSGSNVTVTDNHANATYGGMAPGSDLWLAGVGNLNNADLATSFRKIISYAEAHDNMPVVISNSWGSGWGPRDGTSDFADVVSEYFGDDHPNRVCLFASSNDAGSGSSEGGGFHVTGTASSASPLGTIIRCDTYSTDPGHTYSGLVAAAWGRSSSALRCKLYVLNKSTGAIVASTSAITPGTSVTSLSSYYNGEIYVYSDSQNGKAGCQVWADIQATSGSSSSCPYTLAAEFYPSSGSTTIDVWAGDSYGWFVGDNFVTTTNHTWTCGTDDMSVSDEATIPNAISVGAYVTKTSWKAYSGTTYSVESGSLQDIANFSSYATAAKSPTGQFYPWITAPGAQIVSAVNHYSSDYITGSDAPYRVNTNTTYPYAAMQGTSMATPTAAGIVALWLQVAKENNVELTTNDIKTIMAATAIKDSYVTSGANASHFGNGKIDALAGIQYILDNYVQDPAVAAPALNEAGSVGTDRFTASWSPVDGADSYTLEIGKAAAEPTTVDDVLTRTTTGVTGTQYSSWSGKTGASGAVYAGQSAGGNESIQLRSSNSNSGIISTTSGGKIKKVTVTWNSNTSNGNKLDVYGSNTVYTSPTQLYGNSIVGTKLGSITKGTSTELEITGDYAYIGVRSSSGALYLTDITFTWDKSSTSSGAPRLRAVSDVTDGDVRTISGITGTSHVVTGLEAGATYKFKVKAVSGTDESRWSNEETVKTLEGDPVPEFVVDPSSLTMTATVGESATATVDVYGLNLTQNASLTIGGTDATLFSVTPNTLTPAEAAELTTVTVTYSPTAVGTHTATLTIASEGATSVVIPITATATAPALVVYNPVMTPASDAQIGTTEFTATWTDQTAAANVESYTLYVNKYVAPTTQEVDDVLNYDFTRSSGEGYVDWTGTGTSGTGYKGQSGGQYTSIQLRSNNDNSGIVTTNSVGKVKKVKVTWNSNTATGRTLNVYGKNSAYSAATDLYDTSNQGTLLGTIVKDTSTELTISGDYEYVGVRSNSSAMYLTDITFTWEVPASLSGAPRLRATETGDASTRTISGIDANTKQYTVQNLTAGAVYDYYVKANYTNGESANSNTERVTLKSAPTPELVADETLTFAAAVNATATKTLNVLGSDLTGDVTLTLADESGYFSLSSSTISKAAAEEGADITVTYAPTAAGTHNATITISSAGAEDVTVALNGTATGPTLEADPTSLTFEALVNDNEAKTVDVYGYHLTGNMSLAISGDNASMFTVSDDSFTPDAGGDVSETVTITYAPTAVGTHTATLTISSAGAQNVTVALSGSGVILTDAPVMADAADVTSTSFKAVWTDATAAAYVRDYTLYVNKVEETPEPSTQTVDDVINQSVTGVTGSSYTDWTAICGSGAEYAGICAGSNESVQLRTKNSNEGVVTTTSPGTVKKVVVSWESHTTEGRTLNVYGKNSAYSAASDLFDTSKQGTLLGTIVYGTSTELTIEGNYAYVGVRSASDPMYLTDITFTWEVPASSSGAPRLKEVVEAGDADDDGLVVTGITAKEYTVNDLTAGETYEFYVKANYIDDSNAQSNKKEVTLPDNAPRLAVDPASLTFDEQYTGESTQKTFSVSGANLSDDVTLSVSGDYFTVEPATLTPTGGTLAATVTVTYLPMAVGSHSATVTISSAGATSAEVALSGSAVLKKAVPVMSAAVTETEVGDTWFDAKWTDETPADNVSSYTLYVNKVEETPEPSYELKQTGDFTNGKPEGWSNSAKGISWNKTSGYLQLGAASNPGTVTSPSIDFTDYTKATVIVNTKLWDSGSDMTVTIGESNSTTITGITGDYADHIAVVDISNISDLSDLTVTLGAASGQRLYVKNARIYAGDASSVLSSSGAPRLKEVVEAGDADDDGLVVTGITAKEYTVNGLTPGAKYDYKVKAVYVDEGESAWSNVEQVTLKLTPHTLAEMVADGELGVGDSYAITDGNLLAVALSADRKTLFCKDANGYAQKQSASGSQVDYMVEYGFETPLEYDQSNWVALTSASALSGDLVGSYLTGVSGTVSDLANPSLALAAAPAVGESGSAYLAGTPNRFIPTSFMGESVIESGGKAFFFVAPKPVEVAIVTWACWNGSKFVSVPKTTYTKEGVTSTMNPYNLQGEFTVDTKYLESWPTLTKDEVYEFTAVITREGGASPAPGRLKSATSAGGYGIYPLSAPTSIGSVGGTVTGITGVNGNGAAVESVTIYNSVGVRQSELQRGVNIIVTRYTDGTTRTVKILK